MKKFFVNFAIAALVISTAFSSCNKDDNESTNMTVSGTIYSADLPGWSKVGVSFDEGKTIEKIVPINDGKFTIGLPTPSANQLGESDDIIDDIEEMPSNFTVSEKKVRGVGAQFFVLDANGNEKAQIFLIAANSDLLTKTATVETAGWIFVDKNVDIKGSEDNEESEIALSSSVDLKLKKGWNTILVSVIFAETEWSAVIKTASAPSGAVWMVIDPDDEE